MENIIKQIKKIKGVVTVEKAGENMAVVVFGAKEDTIEFDGRYFFPFGKSSAEINPSIFDDLEPMSEETAKRLLNIFKPKSLSPDELVDGKIYAVEAAATHVFRYKKGKMDDARFVSHYSYKCDTVRFMDGTICVYQRDRILRHATPAEAQSLIRTEIANNFFFELK